MRIPVHLTLGALLLVVVAGCLPYDQSAPVYAPELAGVVTEHSLGQAEYVVTLPGGQQTSVVPGRWLMAAGALEGDLLLAGSSPERWALPVRPAPPGSGWPPGCFALGSEAWLRDGFVDARITLADGGKTAHIRLPTVPGFNAESAADGRLFGPGSLCLDDGGRVFEWVS